MSSNVDLRVPGRGGKSRCPATPAAGAGGTAPCTGTTAMTSCTSDNFGASASDRRFASSLRELARAEREFRDARWCLGSVGDSVALSRATRAVDPGRAPPNSHQCHYPKSPVPRRAHRGQKPNILCRIPIKSENRKINRRISFNRSPNNHPQRKPHAPDLSSAPPRCVLCKLHRLDINNCSTARR